MEAVTNLTFLRRLQSEAIWWGVPMICLDLIGVPIFGWGVVLAIVIPATFVAVLAGSLFEHLLVAAQVKKNETRVAQQKS